MAAHQAPPSLGFSRQEHWSGLPFPSPMHASKKWKWSRSVVSDCSRPHGLQPTRLLHPWDFPNKSTGVGWAIWAALRNRKLSKNISKKKKICSELIYNIEAYNLASSNQGVLGNGRKNGATESGDHSHHLGDGRAQWRPLTVHNQTWAQHVCYL